MKLSSLLCFLALVYPALAQTPDAPTPEIVLPSQQTNDSAPVAPGPPDSLLLVQSPMPEKLNGLGDLVNDIVAYFPMDDTNLGCLAWSTKPVGVVAVGNVVIKQDGGRTYADFSAPGSHLTFNPPLRLGNAFTLAAWIQTPTPKNHGDIWHGSGKGCFLYVTDNSLAHLFADAHAPYATTKTPLSGWYHVAITYDGEVTQCYLNGIPLDAYKGTISDDLGYVGGSQYPEFSDSTRCAGIDEQYVFDRALNADEIKQVMDFSKPSP
jgi:hypothetical protein